VTFTILSAAFANTDNTAAVAQTVEAGSVLLSAVDTPDNWAAMLAATTPAPFVLPPTPAQPSKEDLLAQLAALQAQIAALPDG
jgi:hypothetical protein